MGCFFIVLVGLFIGERVIINLVFKLGVIRERNNCIGIIEFISIYGYFY